MSDPEVRVLADEDELAAMVAEALVTRLAQVQRDGEVPAISLTGGSVARAIHRAVAASADRDRVDWSRVDIFFGDERYVPADDEERNVRQSRQDLLDHVGIDPGRIFEVPASDAGYDSLEAAAAAYAEVVREHGRGSFDVMMLGLGPDGHVASLFPGFPQLDVDDAITVAVTGSPKPPPERISLTFPALNRSAEVWFVVSGDGKADAVARALATGAGAADVHDLPAVGVHGQDRTTWFLDRAAASGLSDRTNGPTG